MNQKNSPLENELAKIKQRLSMLARLSTTKGFIETYYHELGNHTTQIGTFNYLNELYHEFTGEYKYSDYNSFRGVKNKNIKK